MLLMERRIKSAVQVSDEMVTLIGRGASPTFTLEGDAVIFAFGGGEGPLSSLHYRDGADLTGLDASPLVFAVTRAACRRLFGTRPERATTWHLPNALRVLAMGIIDCEAKGEARTTLRLARSIELLCQIHAALSEGTLVPAGGEGGLSEGDVARIASVRQVVDQRWHEKLTIAELARAGGVNRDKLVRGFRDLYGSTIAEILAERRLAEARRMLLATDLPVASVAYRCSYLNNAAFTRAFSRRFGMAPSALRRTGTAA